MTPLDDLDGDPEIVVEARGVLTDGVRRIADDVRNSIDYHVMQDGAGDRRARGPHRTGRSRSPGSPTMLSEQIGLPIEVGAHRRGEARRLRRRRRRPPRGCRRADDRGSGGMKAVNLIPSDSKRGGARAAAAAPRGPAVALIGAARDRTRVRDGLRAHLEHDQGSQGEARRGPDPGDGGAGRRPPGSPTTSTSPSSPPAGSRPCSQIATQRFDWHAALSDLSKVVPAEHVPAVAARDRLARAPRSTAPAAAAAARRAAPGRCAARSPPRRSSCRVHRHPGRRRSADVAPAPRSTASHG